MRETMRGFTATEYRIALERLGLSQAAASRFLGVDERTGRRWAKAGLSPAASKLLSLMLELRFTPEYVDQVTESFR